MTYPPSAELHSPAAPPATPLPPAAPAAPPAPGAARAAPDAFMGAIRCSRICCVLLPGAAHMSSTRWPGSTRSSSGGTIDTSSCRHMLPRSTSVVRNSWKAASRALEARSASVGGGGSSPSAPRRAPFPRRMARETSKRHDSRAGSQAIGDGAGTAPMPGTVSSVILETCSASIKSRSARAVGSSGWPVMRKETPRGARSMEMKASHSPSGIMPSPR
mmetsp:Transcript_32328/g.103142  ORF Transcript_32328/g.103142 Transcript_32328/m.103142 type:complete len:217 (-) Transcript_32328:158-808(-)